MSSGLHRHMEILLLGGIPIMRRSTIDACYDDSDNVIGDHRRGSLPIVFVSSWSELTKEFLQQEWKRIMAVPKEAWDWQRLFIYQYVDRIKATMAWKTRADHWSIMTCSDMDMITIGTRPLSTGRRINRSRLCIAC